MTTPITFKHDEIKPTFEHFKALCAALVTTVDFCPLSVKGETKDVSCGCTSETFSLETSCGGLSYEVEFYTDSFSNYTALDAKMWDGVRFHHIDVQAFIRSL